MVDTTAIAATAVVENIFLIIKLSLLLSESTHVSMARVFDTRQMTMHTRLPFPSRLTPSPAIR
jgi:hypothetical protein